MLNKKKIGMSVCAVLAAGAMVVTPVFAADQNDTISQAKKELKSLETQIASAEKEYDTIFCDENSDLWAKLQAAEDELTDAEYNSADFSEIEFVQKSNDLTSSEKKKLTSLLEKEEKLDTQTEKLYAEREEAEWNSMTKEQQDAVKKVESLCDEENKLYESQEALWDKVADAEADLSEEEYNSEDFDEIAFIKSMDSLTDAQKDTLVKDQKKIDKLNEQIDKLEEIAGVYYED